MLETDPHHSAGISVCPCGDGKLCGVSRILIVTGHGLAVKQHPFWWRLGVHGDTEGKGLWHTGPAARPLSDGEEKFIFFGHP